jgi:hypothetical protein
VMGSSGLIGGRRVFDLRKRQREPELPLKLTRHRKRWLAVLLIGASNVDGSTLCRVAGGPIGDVYMMLAQMERLGWVTGEPDPYRPARFAGDPSLPRSFYRLTPEGRQAVLRFLGLKDGALLTFDK